MLSTSKCPFPTRQRYHTLLNRVAVGPGMYLRGEKTPRKIGRKMRARRIAPATPSSIAGCMVCISEGFQEFSKFLCAIQVFDRKFDVIMRVPKIPSNLRGILHQEAGSGSELDSPEYSILFALPLHFSSTFGIHGQ